MDDDFLFELGFILMMDEVEEREARKSLEESADLDDASREDEDDIDA